MCNIVKAVIDRPPVLALLVFEFLQRFSMNGFRAVLFLYLMQELQYSAGTAIGCFHALLAVQYLAAVGGTVIAAGAAHRMLPLFALGGFYVVANALVVFAATMFDLKEMHYVSLAALALRALCSGASHHVAREVGFDQYSRQDQALHLSALFDWFYGVGLLGALIAFVVAPLLRMHYDCFGKIYCFPLAFGVPAAALVGAYLVMMSESFERHSSDSTGSVLFRFLRYRKYESEHKDKTDAGFDSEFVPDAKQTLRVLMLYIPVPLCWTLFEQQASSWVYQGTRLDGSLVTADHVWHAEPDQMESIGPLVLLTLVPAVRCACARLMPLAGKPRWRMLAGAVMAVAAFVLAALLQMQIEPQDLPTVGPGQGRLLVLNTLHGGKLTIRSTIPENEELHAPPSAPLLVDIAPLAGVQEYKVSYLAIRDSAGSNLSASELAVSRYQGEGFVQAVEGSTVAYLFHRSFPGLDGSPVHDLPFRDLDKCPLQLPKLGIMYVSKPAFRPSALKQDGRNVYDTVIGAPFSSYPDPLLSLSDTRSPDTVIGEVFLDSNHYGAGFFLCRHTEYLASVEGKKQNNESEIKWTLKRGGVYVAWLIWNAADGWESSLKEVNPPNTVPMWWQIPQHILLIFAQCLLPGTLLEYSFTQVPVRMQPVLMAFWMMALSLSHLIVSVVGFSQFFRNTMVYYFYFYAGLMCVAGLLMIVLVARYKPLDTTDEGDIVQRLRILHSVSSVAMK